MWQGFYCHSHQSHTQFNAHQYFWIVKYSIIVQCEQDIHDFVLIFQMEIIDFFFNVPDFVCGLKVARLCLFSSSSWVNGFYPYFHLYDEHFSHSTSFPSNKLPRHRNSHMRLKSMLPSFTNNHSRSNNSESAIAGDWPPPEEDIEKPLVVIHASFCFYLRAVARQRTVSWRVSFHWFEQQCIFVV